MGSTRITSLDGCWDALTDKMKVFVAEYLIHHDGTKAVIAAGYSKNGAAVRASKLLQDPRIKKVIAHEQGKVHKGKRLEKEKVLKKIADSLHRNLWDFEVEQGKGLIVASRLRDLPRRCHCYIDGFEVTQYFDDPEEPTKVTRQKIKVKLSPNAAVQEMAMKHIGAFAPDKVLVNENVSIDWKKLHEPIDPNTEDEEDPIEGEILKIEREGHG